MLTLVFVVNTRWLSAEASVLVPSIVSAVTEAELLIVTPGNTAALALTVNMAVSDLPAASVRLV